MAALFFENFALFPKFFLPDALAWTDSLFPGKPTCIIFCTDKSGLCFIFGISDHGRARFGWFAASQKSVRAIVKMSIYDGLLKCDKVRRRNEEAAERFDNISRI